MLETLLLALCLFHSASALHVNLHHRLLVPENGAKLSAFTYKGSVEIDTSILSSIQASYNPASSYESDITNFLRVAHNNDDNQSSSSSVLYQVALELPDVNQNSWPFTSVNVCHWRAASGERIWLHTSPTGSPHSLSYWLLDSPNDGTCPPVTQKAALNSANWNTTVIVKTPTSPPSPSLRVPPTLSPEGTPVEPEPEKSFIQKYWMYLIGGFLVMSLILPAPEEAAQGQQGGDGK